MFEEDKLMREIKQLHLILEKIFKLTRQSNYIEAEQIIGMAVKNLSGINLQLVTFYETEDLLTMMANYDRHIFEDRTKLQSISTLIFEKAKLDSHKKDNQNNKIYLTKALELLIHSFKLPKAGNQPEQTETLTGTMQEQLDMAKTFDLDPQLIQEATKLYNSLSKAPVPTLNRE